MNKIYLAGGCFWCIGDYLSSFHGIIDVISGYSGGEEKDISYEDVKNQKTGHRETVEIIFDESLISKEEIIDIYFSYIDPFDKEGQYIDKGYSYTLAMYYTSNEEKELFIRKVNELKNKEDREIYIAIEPFKFFVQAEEYHQHFGDKNPDKLLDELKQGNRTCHIKLKNKN